MNLKAIFDAVIVKPIEEEEKKFGSIIVPDIGKQKPLIGIIVSVGEGKPSFNGEFIPTTLKEGTKVILPPMGPVKTEFQDQEYWICPENQILAIIEE
jgi:chaperonin GroES